MLSVEEHGEEPKVSKISVTDAGLPSSEPKVGRQLTSHNRFPNTPAALSALRARLSLKSGETVAPQDDRLTLVGGWLESSPGAQDLFNVWDGMDQVRGRISSRMLARVDTVQVSTQAIVISLLSSILSLLSSHFPYHIHGVPIIKALLSPQWLRRLNSYLDGTHNELIFSTLKFFNAISIFGSGR